MSMTANQLATAVRMAAPRVQTMIEALLQAQADILGHEVGTVQLGYAHAQVKLSLVVSLGCYRLELQEGEAEAVAS